MSLGVIQLDPWLSPFKDALRSRFSRAQDWIKKINETEGGLEKFSRVCLRELSEKPRTEKWVRDTKSMASMSKRMEILSTENGHRMLLKHSSLESSVRALKIIDLTAAN
jgi:hypothetical protein